MAETADELMAHLQRSATRVKAAVQQNQISDALDDTMGVSDLCRYLEAVLCHRIRPRYRLDLPASSTPGSGGAATSVLSSSTKDLFKVSLLPSSWQQRLGQQSGASTAPERGLKERAAGEAYAVRVASVWQFLKQLPRCLPKGECAALKVAKTALEQTQHNSPLARVRVFIRASLNYGTLSELLAALLWNDLGLVAQFYDVSNVLDEPPILSIDDYVTELFDIIDSLKGIHFQLVVRDEDFDNPWLYGDFLSAEEHVEPFSEPLPGTTSGVQARPDVVVAADESFSRPAVVAATLRGNPKPRKQVRVVVDIESSANGEDSSRGSALTSSQSSDSLHSAPPRRTFTFAGSQHVPDIPHVASQDDVASGIEGFELLRELGETARRQPASTGSSRFSTATSVSHHPKVDHALPQRGPVIEGRDIVPHKDDDWKSPSPSVVTFAPSAAIMTEPQPDSSSPFRMKPDIDVETGSSPQNAWARLLRDEWSGSHENLEDNSTPLSGRASVDISTSTLRDSLSDDPSKVQFAGCRGFIEDYDDRKALSRTEGIPETVVLHKPFRRRELRAHRHDAPDMANVMDDTVDYSPVSCAIYEPGQHPVPSVCERPNCSGQLSTSIFATVLFCYYYGQYCCKECHHNDKYAIPGRLVQRLDRRPYPVCAEALVELEFYLARPCIPNIVRENRSIYSRDDTFERVRVLRNQLLVVAAFTLSCTRDRDKLLQVMVGSTRRRSVDPDAEESLLKLKLPFPGSQSRKADREDRGRHLVQPTASPPASPHKPNVFDMVCDRTYMLFQPVHRYSLLDVMTLPSLPALLENILEFYITHVTKTCESCRNRGFFCELCGKPELVFPFQPTAYVCPKCRTCYHHSCIPQDGTFSCSVCPRSEATFLLRRSRSKSSPA